MRLPSFPFTGVRVGVALALLLTPAILVAQRRITLSPGVALGAAVDQGAVRGTAWASGRHAMLTLDVAAPNIPLRLRGEAMAVALPQAHGPVSLGASLVLPVGGGRVRPYVLAGAGVYGIGGVGHPIGWNAGAGAEFRRRSATLFIEARRHSETPTAVSVGLRW